MILSYVRCSVNPGSGRATCRVCGKKIEKSQKQINMNGDGGQSCVIHSNPMDCESSRYELQDLVAEVANATQDNQSQSK